VNTRRIRATRLGFRTKIWNSPKRSVRCGRDRSDVTSGVDAAANTTRGRPVCAWKAVRTDGTVNMRAGGLGVAVAAGATNAASSTSVVGGRRRLTGPSSRRPR
jgi:hypothetical protein